MSTVALVEDNPHLRALMAEILTLEQHDVRQYETSIDALAALEAGEMPDILVTDYHTAPSLSGYELARQAREMSPGLRVLIVTGSHEGPMPDPSFDALRKPFSAAELLEAVRAARRPGRVA